MNNAKHTPGPWVVEPAREDGWALVTHNHHVVANVNAEHLALWPDAGTKALPQMANANLIAAAPELLLQCQRALGVIGALHRAHPDADQYLSNVMSDLSAAITKAEGSLK